MLRSINIIRSHMCGSQPLAVNIHKHIYKPGNEKRPMWSEQRDCKGAVKKATGPSRKGDWGKRIKQGRGQGKRGESTKMKYI